jgi:protein required for attachment to host cells
MLIPHGALILVIDGARMQLLRNRGREAAPDLEAIREQKLENPPSRLQGTDAPGRNHESEGPSRHAYASDDPHDRRKDRFAAQAVTDLGAAARDGAPIILIAPPHVLGILRAAVRNERLERHIIAEINKDLTPRTPDEIALLLLNHET